MLFLAALLLVCLQSPACRRDSREVHQVDDLRSRGANRAVAAVFAAIAITCFSPPAEKLAQFTETGPPMQSSKFRMEKNFPLYYRHL
jgi:hypothetical protein